MKKKEKTTLRSMKAEELRKTISDAQTKLAQWKVNRYSKQSKNVRVGRAFKRQIAIAKTYLRMTKEA